MLQMLTRVLFSALIAFGSANVVAADGKSKTQTDEYAKDLVTFDCLIQNTKFKEDPVLIEKARLTIKLGSSWSVYRSGSLRFRVKAWKRSYNLKRSTAATRLGTMIYVVENGIRSHASGNVGDDIAYYAIDHNVRILCQTGLAKKGTPATNRQMLFRKDRPINLTE